MARLSTALAFCFAASAAAFAPSAQSVKKSALNAIPPEKQIGVQAPLGFFE